MVILGRRFKPDLSEHKGNVDEAVTAAVQHLERFADVAMSVAAADALVKLVDVIAGFHTG